MSEWIDFSVYTAFIAAIWGWLPSWGTRFTVARWLRDRNPEWVAAHPDVIAKVSDSPWFRRICRTWSVISVTVLLALQLELWAPAALAGAKWEALKDANAVLMFPGCVFLLGCGILFGRWVEKHVPVAPRRQATLERRHLSDFVPGWARTATYGAIVLHVAAWLAVAALQRYSTPDFWGRFAVNMAMPVIFFFVVQLGVNRRPGAMDRIIGPTYRRFEVRFAFGLQLIPPIGGAVRIYEEVAATTLTDVNRLMHLAIPFMIVTWTIWLARMSRHIPGDATPLGRRGMRVTGVVALAAVMTLSGSAVHAQDLAGAWQGTINPGKELRLVFVIANTEGGALRATMHSIDQGGQAIAATATLQGTTVRMGVAAINGTFEGRLSADATSIIGALSQGGGSLPLTLVRATRDTAWPIPGPPVPMAADAPITFEVATIKPSNPDTPMGKLFTVKGRQVLTINTTAVDLIAFAYGVHARQISGGPEWMRAEKYDVTGQPDAQGVPNERQLRGMVQKLLEDRFTLTIHRETKELGVYAITIGTGGPKLARNETNPDGLPSLLFRGLGVLPAVNASMADFAGVMQTAVLDRPVVDRTGLPGRYDFTLTWTADESQFAALGVRVPPPSGDPNAPPGLFTAIQEQLGLKLESTNAPVSVLVVDRVEKPSEN
jgi:uncharacterized protein (TIGR03435 family)